MSQIYYHYTTLDGFYSIIKDKRLLLTSLNNMNDPDEGNYSVEDFLIDIKELEQKYSTAEPYISVLLNEAEKNKQQFTELCKMPSEPYSTCFSKKKDSMSHWERYAQNMTGICIAFDIDELYKINLPYFESFSIKEITYTKEERIERLHYGLKKYVEQLKLGGKDTLDDEKLCRILKINGYSHLAAAYQSILFFIKNSYWNEEEEIRLLYDDCAWHNKMNLYKQIEEKWMTDLTSIAGEWYGKSGLSGKQFIKLSTIRTCKYLEMDEVWSSKLIPEIIIGPFSRQNSEDLNEFVRNSGLDLEKTIIKKSDIRIR